MHKLAGLFAAASLAVAAAVVPTVTAQPLLDAHAPHGVLAPGDSLEASNEELELSDEEIETFAAIYVELRHTADKYEREIAAVESEQEAQEVQTRMQQESIDALERHGWTVEKFDRVAKAVNRSPELVERALRLIEKRS